MKEIPNTLFTEETIQRLTSNVILSPKQKKAAKDWKNYLDEGKIKVETQHEKLFADKILIDLLGFPDVDAGLEQKTNFMDYSIPPIFPKKGIVIELKSRTKNLQTEQVNYPSGKKTPVKQTIYYMRNNHDYDYGICTNYEEFILLKTPDYNQCYSFVFPKKGDDFTEEKIKEFVAIFSKENIDAGFVEKLVHESIIEQKRLTDDFYKLFHETRLMLIRTFEKNSENISSKDSIKYAQMFLNRLIFVFFAEDNDLINSKLFSDEILNILKKGDIKKGTTKISDHIGTIFKWMDSGSVEIDHKLGFNGELFKESLTRDAFFYDFSSKTLFADIEKQTKYSKKPELNQEIQKIIKQYDGDLNPIIKNLLIMDSYDFRDQINVNILGHIFEQSIGDLEELRQETVSQRKKDGVYYTPDYITEFICQNTIIPHLSKKGITDPDELILEYVNNIGELEKKINDIKILDPACGSGAFLVQAVDVLLDISDKIQLFKQSKGEYTITKKGKRSGLVQQGTLDIEYDDLKARDIIQNNIYGVDVNPESVEITKLSLFLKIASKNKRLIGLSQRIKIGNSLVSDKSIDEKAFDWKSEFAEILDEKYGSGGFDIVVGNPPYLNLKGLHESHDHTTAFFKENFRSATERYDYYVLFAENASKLVKKDGYLSFILPHKFINAQFGKGIRKYFLDTKILYKIISFGHNPIFDDSTTYTCILTLRNNKNEKFSYAELYLYLPGQTFHAEQGKRPDILELGAEVFAHETYSGM
jgi:tRNA1(Val) A37 N6-methylase TrmN6